MSTLAPGHRGARLLPLVAACAVILAVGLGFYATRGSGAEVVDESAGPTGWKTIEYEDVRVDVPGSWERWDTDGCEFQFERWGPPGLPPCEADAGVAFYGSATFDPAHRPGVRRTEASGAEAGDWGGYVYAGDFAVYASDDDPDVVEGILRSATARRTGAGPPFLAGVAFLRMPRIRSQLAANHEMEKA